MVKKVEDYKCPNCGVFGEHEKHRSTLVNKTDTIFTGDYKQFDYEPGGFWLELHKCDKYETLFCYENGY